MSAWGRVLACALSLAACGGPVPEIHYYELAVLQPMRRPASDPRLVLAIEPFEANAAYESEQMVYRVSPYRMDYYHYHRWSASPALTVADYLREAFSRTGRFRRVVLEPSPNAPLVLGGRVLALEEVDVTEESWYGQVVLELSLESRESGEVVWSQTFSEREKMEQRSPEGLARALSLALDRIVAASTGPIAAALDTAARADARREPAATR
ncbi:MAG TPA: ABC-type transport auxiliary lipoprotein family protein [Polyangiaceae bacterium]|nr:ABC-type transport auxiliary lipoprotein family protein [Polyangiaceae bacterium]